MKLRVCQLCNKPLDPADPHTQVVPRASGVGYEKVHKACLASLTVAARKALTRG